MIDQVSMKGWSNTDSSHHCWGDHDAQSGCLHGRKQSRGGSWHICSFCPTGPGEGDGTHTR